MFGAMPVARTRSQSPCGAVRIMVAGQKMPVHLVEAAHPLQRCAQIGRFRAVGVVNIAGNQDMLRAVLNGQRADRLDHVEPSGLEHGFPVPDLLEDLADLPVSAVDKSHRDFSIASVIPSWAAPTPRYRQEIAFAAPASDLSTNDRINSLHRRPRRA